MKQQGNLNKNQESALATETISGGICWNQNNPHTQLEVKENAARSEGTLCGRSSGGRRYFYVNVG